MGLPFTAIISAGAPATTVPSFGIPRFFLASEVTDLKTLITSLYSTVSPPLIVIRFHRLQHKACLLIHQLLFLEHVQNQYFHLHVR
jgi:hypothetical protein